MLSFFKKVDNNKFFYSKLITKFDIVFQVEFTDIEEYYRSFNWDIKDYFQELKYISINLSEENSLGKLPDGVENNNLYLDICYYYRDEKFPNDWDIETINFYRPYYDIDIPDSFKVKYVFK